MVSCDQLFSLNGYAILTNFNVKSVSFVFEFFRKGDHVLDQFQRRLPSENHSSGFYNPISVSYSEAGSTSSRFCVLSFLQLPGLHQNDTTPALSGPLTCDCRICSSLVSLLRAAPPALSGLGGSHRSGEVRPCAFQHCTVSTVGMLTDTIC